VIHIELFCGIDVSTSSIKVIIINEKGEIISSTGNLLPKSNIFKNENGYQCHEQRPSDWWDVLVKSLKESVFDLKKNGISSRNLKGISITGTSGTLIAIDEKNEPVINALMYNDERAIKEAEKINRYATNHCEKLGYKFSAPFALSKIIWIAKKKPNLIKKLKFINCTDYIVGKLTNIFDKSDFSNALKMGFDLLDLRWPQFIQDDLEIPLESLPKIISPGEYIGTTSKEIEEQTGITEGTYVYAGLTDSTAGLISSGAINPGDLYTVLGSTIVSKVITKKLVKDNQGRIYNHLFPTGNFILGGAGNCGTYTLNEVFGRNNLKSLDKEIKEYIPTKSFIYPLFFEGERFPFNNPKAKGFIIGNFKNIKHKYSSYIEGLTYVEKMMFEVFEELNVKCNNIVYSVGGGTHSKQWMQLRASILNKKIIIPRIPEAAYGVALLIASNSLFNGDLKKTVESFVNIKEVFIPEDKWVDVYNSEYQAFKKIIIDKVKNEWI